MQRKIFFIVGIAALVLLAISPIPNLIATRLSSDAPGVVLRPTVPAEPQAQATESPQASAPDATATAPASTPEPTAVPTATPTPTPETVVAKSALEGKTWITVYGRAFGIAPILGRLGSSNTLDDVAADIAPWVAEVKNLNGGKEIVPVLHLIYAMAIPCEADNHCLLYLDTAGEDIVADYIKPAAERGWQVILDTQIGSSDPVAQVQRMIDRGYLDYPNVHVALDPEFHVYPGEDLPGIPIGQIDASAINKVQHMLDKLVAEKNLPSKKVLIVHQFGDPMVNDGNPFMITNKTTLETVENVDLVIDADGFGPPSSKTKKYNLMTDPTEYPFIKFRGIKLFFFNPFEERHHGDKPVMTWPQVFGQEQVTPDLKMDYVPDVIIVA
ncbi:MAG: hypothetical protein M0Z94_02125 [Dehalococcoidales bacterium]|nr:hypothetical protein [Dehalococcoidales bacterium]